MPGSRYRYKQNGNCWENRSGVEKLLICAAIIVLILVIALVVLLLLQLNKNSVEEEICNSPTCVGEASQLIQRVDSQVNPCDDFYKFACGNLLKNARGDEKLGPFFVIQDKAKRQIQEMYSEPLRDDDHRTVKTAKKLYRACLNETAIEKGSLETVKEVLRVTGGWPVVQGPKWIESKFWWIRTTYRLREMGYFYSSFLDLTVDVNPINENRFMLKISVPDVKDISENFQIKNKQEFMADVAIAFGADRERALKEMGETYDFMLNMQKQSYLRRNDEPHRLLTVTEFQRQYELINWMELIKNIIGPTVGFFKDDYVLFPSSHSIEKWFDFILSTPKRVQANYIMWKAIEEMIPYLPALQNANVKPKFVRDPFGNQETRSEFCIRQIRERFVPSPIDIMYVRKYLPAEKKRKVEDLIKDLKTELLNVMDKAEWMDATEKQIASERVVQMQEVVGAPGNYFDNEILDDLNVDMEESNSTNFLSLLSKANRNHQSWKYNQIYNTKYESKIARWNLQTASVIGDYFPEENVISIPATILQGVIFDENRPKCLNYGSMGTLIGHHFLQVFGESPRIFDKDGNVIDGWTKDFQNVFKSKRDCFNKQIENANITNLFTTDLILHQSLGLKISYAAYKAWAESHGEEAKLLDSDYRPNQLFWISAASYFCQPLNFYNTTFKSPEEQEVFTFIVSRSMLNNKDFSKDFQCPVGSRMNPPEKCEIF